MEHKVFKFLLVTIVVAFLAFSYFQSKDKNTDKVSEVNADNNIINPEEYTRHVMQKCFESGGRSACLKEAATDLRSKLSLEKILEIFVIYEKEKEFFNQCHELAHYLGRGEYNITKSIRKVFAQSSRSCLGGAYHGAVEGYLIERREKLVSGLSAADDVREACGTLTEYELPQEFIECNHGLGHAVMFLADYELPDALTLCDSLKTHGEQELCYTGAFMANADAALSGEHPTRFIKQDDPLYPCPVLDDRYAQICYTYAVLTRFQYDPDKSIAICESVPIKYRGDCFETFGRDRTMTSASETELKDQCYKVKDAESRNHCISGVAYNLVIRFGPDSQLPYLFCKAIDKESKEICYRQIGNALKPVLRNKEAQERRCNNIEEEQYRAVCVN